MKDLPALVDAICEASEMKKFRPDGDTTFCNQAVAYVARAMGYDLFNGLLANDMVAQMERGDRWERVTPTEAQTSANEGRLVVAGQIHESHGHVCVIRPGCLVYSLKWQKNVPTCLNVGKSVFLSFLEGNKVGTNGAFGVDEPVYYRLKEAV